MLTIFLI